MLGKSELNRQLLFHTILGRECERKLERLWRYEHTRITYPFWPLRSPDLSPLDIFFWEVTRKRNYIKKWLRYKGSSTNFKRENIISCSYSYTRYIAVHVATEEFRSQIILSYKRTLCRNYRLKNKQIFVRSDSFSRSVLLYSINI